MKNATLLLSVLASAMLASCAGVSPTRIIGDTVGAAGGAHGVGDHAAPVVADEVDLAAEVIDQGEGVGGEGVEVVGTDDRRGGVAAQPWRDDAVGLGEVLEERDGGRRVIGEAVEEEERARVDRAADERVNLAERQRERGAGQPLMRCVHKSDQL